MNKFFKYLAVLGPLLASCAHAVRHGHVTSKPNPDSTPPIPRKLTEFKNQDGIKKLINDYKLIKSGKSKKGQLKQNRIIGKINWLIEQGILKTDDLKISK